MNIDGIPFFKSTKHTCWPILLSCNVSPVSVFPVTISYANSKPKHNEFMKENKKLMKSGLDIFENYLGVQLNAMPCDSPARSMIKCVKGHAG